MLSGPWKRRFSESEGLKIVLGQEAGPGVGDHGKRI